MRVGVIGTGSVADVYVRNARLFRNYEIAAVASRDIGRARAQAAAWGVAATTVEAMLADPDIGLILNLTPPNAHFATSKAALLAGKHVFCEKPLCPTFAEARALCATAAERGLRLGAAPDSMLGAGIQRARQMIDAGAIGQPLSAMGAILYHGAERWHPNPAFFYQPGGGPVHDVGPYFLSAMASLLGPIATVQSIAGRGFDTRTVTAEGREKGLTFPVEVPTSVFALLTFRSGVQGTLATSWDVWKTTQPDLEIHGTEGSLSLPHPNFFGGPLRFARPGGEWEDIRLDDEPFAMPNWPFDIRDRCNYRGVGIAEMVEAIAEGRPHRTTAELALHVVEAADAIMASAVSGERTGLALTPERPRPFTRSDLTPLLA